MTEREVLEAIKNNKTIFYCDKCWDNKVVECNVFTKDRLTYLLIAVNEGESRWGNCRIPKIMLCSLRATREEAEAFMRGSKEKEM